MFSDTLFNFTQITDEFGLEGGAEILSKMAEKEPFFALDCGTSAEDIWLRCDRYRQCVDLLTDDEEKKLASNMIYFSAGIMPDYDSVENRFAAVEALEQTIDEFKNSDDEFAGRLVAIGPCGIDHDWDSVEYEGRQHDYFDHSTISDEKDLFALQLTLAKKLNMPFILHSRKGFKDTVDVIKAVKWNKGVVHGFAYTQSELEFFLDAGWYISFNGSVTYSGKNQFIDMASMVDYVPNDRLLIESDSPYYAPIPLKNTRNNPANMNYIYQYIAAKRNITSRKLSDIVDTNCKKLFGL